MDSLEVLMIIILWVGLLGFFALLVVLDPLDSSRMDEMLVRECANECAYRGYSFVEYDEMCKCLDGDEYKFIDLGYYGVGK